MREWVKAAERDDGLRADGGLTSSEREELAALRRDNRRLRVEKYDIPLDALAREFGPLACRGG